MIAAWHFKIVFNGEFFSIETFLCVFIKKYSIVYLETLKNIKLRDNLLCLFFCNVLVPCRGFEQCYLWVHDEGDDKSMKYDNKVRLNFSIFCTWKVH